MPCLTARRGRRKGFAGKCEQRTTTKNKRRGLKKARGRLGAFRALRPAGGTGFRVEHATRVLFPATRRKHLMAHGQTRRTSKSVRLQICAPHTNSHASCVWGESPQTAPEPGAPPGRRPRARRSFSVIFLQPQNGQRRRRSGFFSGAVPGCCAPAGAGSFSRGMMLTFFSTMRSMG
jgi:hypothetical protein